MLHIPSWFSFLYGGRIIFTLGLKPFADHGGKKEWNKGNSSS